jgi:hypothetical protein
VSAVRPHAGRRRVRDAFCMPTHRITYRGPAALAVSTATAVADSTGVELTSSSPPERGDDGETVTLHVTVDGRTDAVMAAVARIAGDLPSTARLTVDESG